MLSSSTQLVYNLDVGGKTPDMGAIDARLYELVREGRVTGRANASYF